MDYSKLILDKLLNKYEDSGYYRGDNTINRRVMLKLGPKSRDLKEYDIEDFEKKELIHSVVSDLSMKELISYDWEPFNRGNIIASVWLNFNKVELAYAYIGRLPKAQLVELVLHKLQVMLDNLEIIQHQGKASANLQWAKEALKAIYENMLNKKQVSPYFPEAMEQIEFLLTAIRELCILSEGELLERVFSLRCYKDSKCFEQNVRSRLVSFIKKYGPIGYDINEEISDEEILRSVGISKNPEIIEFCGPIELSINGHKVEYQHFCKGAAINTDTIKIITGIDLKEVKKVTFIENRSSFSQYINNELAVNELVIYHGGFYSPMRGEFFRQIYKWAEPDTEFYHWGDIDLGGFMIFLRLKREIIPQLKQYRMDVNTLIAMREFAKEYSNEYRKQLKKALQNIKFKEFYITLESMLEMGVRLEQEAFLL